MKTSLKLATSLIILFIFNSCSGLYNKDAQNVPINAEDRARQNVNEGRGVSLKGMVSGGKTNYEFSSSNPLWRATLELIDFLPLTTVDYSGGMIITDWYNDDYNKNESIKITVQFLSNEVRSDSLKITVHKKNCGIDTNCKTNILNSNIKEQLTSEILKKAAVLEKENQNKKK